jgi:hypothetical protein
MSSKPIVVTVPHNLGAETARQRVALHIEQVRKDYVDRIAHSEVVWTQNRADVRISALGQMTTMQIDVLNDALRIEVQLPWFLSALSNTIRDALTSNARDSLRLGPPKG